MSDSLGLVDFAIGLVNSGLNLPNSQVKVFGELELQKNCSKSCLSKKFFFGLIKMILGLVHASYSLPEWQAYWLSLHAKRGKWAKDGPQCWLARAYPFLFSSKRLGVLVFSLYLHVSTLRGYPLYHATGNQLYPALRSLKFGQSLLEKMFAVIIEKADSSIICLFKLTPYKQIWRPKKPCEP